MPSASVSLLAEAPVLVLEPMTTNPPPAARRGRKKSVSNMVHEAVSMEMFMIQLFLPW